MFEGGGVEPPDFIVTNVTNVTNVTFCWLSDGCDGCDVQIPLFYTPRVRVYVHVPTLVKPYTQNTHNTQNPPRGVIVRILRIRDQILKTRGRACCSLKPAFHPFVPLYPRFQTLQRYNPHGSRAVAIFETLHLSLVLRFGIGWNPHQSALVAL